MTQRHFEDKKIQDIYDSEYAKELAKVDAQRNEKAFKCIPEYVLLTILIICAALYIFKMFFS